MPAAHTADARRPVSTMNDDPRLDAFLAPDAPEVFHPVAYRNDVWRPDPFDVEAIHAEAREAFEHLVRRAATPPGLPSGRILLVLGEAGCGKTHLMRAFRNRAHSAGLGYCGYMQMTASVDDYGRYLLGNLIDSLDQPYDEPRGGTTGLMRLSTAMADSAGAAGGGGLVARLRDDELAPDELTDLVDDVADRVVADERFDRVDFDLVRAMLYLQRDDPRVRGRVLKYLRCEGLTAADRRVLGGLEPRTYDGAPLRLAEKLGGLMRAVDSAALVLCVDQLEDIYNMEEAPRRFRRATATFCELVNRVPSSVVVVACLEDFYQRMRGDLARPVLDRLENAPAPVRLVGNRTADEARALVAQRLACLFDSAGAGPRDDDPTFPIPAAALEGLAGQRSRDVLAWCHEYRERCARAGALLDPGAAPAPAPARPAPAGAEPVTGLERLWNDFAASRTWDVPADDAGQLALLAWAVGACSDEVATGHRFAAEVDDPAADDVPTAGVTCEGADGSVERLVVGLCNRSAQGGGLGKQIAALARRGSAAAPAVVPVAVRSTEFPRNPKTQVANQLGRFLTAGGRRAVVEDADWRAMLALRAFRADHGSDPAFAAWLRRERPLSQRNALRAVLNLDRPPAPAAAARRPAAAPAGAGGSSSSDPDAGPLVVGASADRAAAAVALEVGELVRHAAFLGATGSGKTTLALNVVEQLLLRDVPAVLIDRKGDLCGYAAAGAWPAPDDPDAAARADRLRRRVDVALYTPGNPAGRPLSIALAPEGLGRLPTADRERVARYAAAALGGMMNYGNRGNDLSRLAVLARAIELLALERPGEPVGLEPLTACIHEKDPALVNAVGLLDTKLFDRLVQDLETLRLTRGPLLTASGERLDPEALLGLGRHARPGRTRLSVVSTKFLGGAADVQFWVSQFLVAMARWAGRSPSPALQAVVLFDEADLYLPAQRQPPAKEPMEDLLRRARAAGLGLLLATQSPGDFDYRCRDQIRSWFVGRVKEPTALAKMKPMLAECRVDVASKLPGQGPGAFHLLRDGTAVGLRAGLNALPPVQLPEDRILELARGTLATAP